MCADLFWLFVPAHKDRIQVVPIVGEVYIGFLRGRSAIGRFARDEVRHSCHVGRYSSAGLHVLEIRQCWNSVGIGDPNRGWYRKHEWDKDRSTTHSRPPSAHAPILTPPPLQ